MDNDLIDRLKALHTSAIDARNGYREALADADGKGMTPLFREMIALHEANAGELARELAKANVSADNEGSFMSTVHKTIMDVRSLFNGLDESVLPGLIDGEKRNVAKYNDAADAARGSPGIAALLDNERAAIVRKIGEMEALRTASEGKPS